MPRASPLQYNLNSGEWSPLLAARVDQDKYRNALGLCRDFLPMIQGGVTRRPGTKFFRHANETVTQTQAQGAILVPFQFNVEQVYVLEFGHEYIRFFTPNGWLVDGSGVALEVATPYQAEDLDELNWTQSADVLYLVHPKYAPRKLQRFGTHTWQLDEIKFLDGPYLDLGDVNTTISVSNTTPATITASTGIFAAEDVGRLFRVLDEGGTPEEWYWFTITSFISSTSVNATAERASVTINDSSLWRFGAYQQDSYPRTVIFHENRLWFGGAPFTPQRVDGSASGDFENFAPTDVDGTVNDDNAISAVLNSDQVNAIQWLSVNERGLLVGTQGGEWFIRGFSQAEPISPTNIQAVASTKHGSSDVRPLRIGHAALFVQRDSRTVRELVFDFNIDGFQAPDLTVLSEHLTRNGIKRMVFQAEPQRVVWAVTKTGELLSLTYEREQDVVGWAKHTIAGTNAFVQSIAVIPSDDAVRDEVWLLVRRDIEGVQRFFVDKMTPIWQGGEHPWEPFYVDAGRVYDGSARNDIGALGHLEGETVSILSEGAVHPDRVVKDGVVILDHETTFAHIGLGYTSELETLNIEAGAADGTAQGKIKRIHRVVYRLFESLGGETGPDVNTLSPIVFRKTSDDISEAVPLFTGDRFIDWDGDYERPGTVYFRQAQPLTTNMLAIMPQLLTQDGG